MREWCSCGGGINTFSRRQVNIWRDTHRHDPTPEGPQGTTSQVELADRDFIEEAHIGFQPNRQDT